MYFDGEKCAGLFLAGFGAATIAYAALFLRGRFGFRSFAVTLIVLAVAEIALGVGLFVRTGPQVTRLVAQMSSDSSRFYQEEGSRMTRVRRNFVIIEWIEMAIIILAALIAVTQKSRPAVLGVALAFLLHGSLVCGVRSHG